MSKKKQGFPKISDKARMAGVVALKAQSTSNQIKVLSDSLHTGKLKADYLRGVFQSNAPNEMRKGADKLIKQNKVLSVDALLEEYRNDKGFKALAAEVGLDEPYFIGLAEQEIKKRVVEPEPAKMNPVKKFFSELVHGD